MTELLSENKLVALTATSCSLTPPIMSCPGWDLNPHRTEFETAASAVGLPGRPEYVSPDRRKGLTYFACPESLLIGSPFGVPPASNF